MLFAVSRRGALLTMPRPLSRCQIKAEIKGFLLMYSMFLYKQWFSQNIEKGWRKFFEKDYFRDFLKMTKIIRIYFLQPFPILWTNHCYYRNKRHLSKKPLISALIWHPESGRGIIMRASRPLAAKSIGPRGVKKVVLRREGVAASW